MGHSGHMQSYLTCRRLCPPLMPWSIESSSYVIGGSPLNVGIDNVYAYDSSTWQTKFGMQQSRLGHRAVVFNNAIYVTGGSSSNAASSGLDSVEVYAGTKWSYAASMSAKRRFHGSSVFMGRIYVIGGEDTSTGTRLNSVESYDGTSAAWRSEPDLPLAASYVSSVVYQGRLFVAGDIGTATALFSSDGATWSSSSVQLPATSMVMMTLFRAPSDADSTCQPLCQPDIWKVW